jgi:hypothetical protein
MKRRVNAFVGAGHVICLIHGTHRVHMIRLMIASLTSDMAGSKLGARPLA